MSQTLLLGLGGTGGRIVNYVAETLHQEGIRINDSQLCCAILDTNENDRKKIVKTGVGVPVIPMSKDRLIGDYISMYAGRGVKSWMPESPALNKQSMLDGASQMRPKSRLALLDTIDDGTINQLSALIERLFNNRDGSKIRVMIVSSLAGGTGSGMFIQIALWLRKYFSERKCSATIRGIFVLPDVFVKCLDDIRNDRTEQQSFYANAYGAIRELNAITKIKTKGLVPFLPVKIDDLFNSKNGQDGMPVYDYAFFVDSVAEGGSELKDIVDYEQVVARMVYMQLYAPAMPDDLNSEEDNLFKRFEKSSEPVFGSCGTAKAVYPKDDILEYCALRAAQDSLSKGWRRIDDEIKTEQDREDEQERNGIVLTKKLDPRARYIRLFEEKTSRTGAAIGSDRLFINIADDIKNLKIGPGEDGTISIERTDKVQDFIEKIDDAIAAVVDTNATSLGLKNIKLPDKFAPIQNQKGSKTTVQQKNSNYNTKDELKKLVEDTAEKVKRFLERKDDYDDIADEIIRLMFPEDMGDINRENEESVFGLITKKDKDGKTYFIHPVAIRYMLYKLASVLDNMKDAINDTERLSQVIKKGGTVYADGRTSNLATGFFDNVKTKGTTEETPLEYLDSKAFLQNEKSFIDNFKTKYKEYNELQYESCRKYAICCIKKRLFTQFTERLDALIQEFEKFFRNLFKVSDKLNEKLAENIRKNEEFAQKIIYVCASKDDKEELYQSLKFDTAKSDSSVNEIIAYALYGQFCAKENPNAENNKKYKGKKLEVMFYQEAVAAYAKRIIASNGQDIDLDIYSAVCKSADMEYEKARKKNSDVENDDIDTLDFESEETADDMKYSRHYDAMRELVGRLRTLSAPFLISNEEFQDVDPDEHLKYTANVEEAFYKASENNGEKIFTPIKKRKTFWGFNPVVAKECKDLARLLGVNVEMQKNSAYAKNELYCYRAVYGIQAGYIDKFNELGDGLYYRNYKQVVDEMVKAGNPEALVHTPHLDKTWHLFLPYITPEKQKFEDNRFYRLFWLALAYGTVYLGKDNFYYIKRVRETSMGGYEHSEQLLYNGRPISKVNVFELIAALKFDATFMNESEASLEAKFSEECEKAATGTYEGTVFLKGKGEKDKKTGGLATKQDTNALTIIIRYKESSKNYSSPKHIDDMTFTLMQSLLNICYELVKNRYDEDEDNKAWDVAYELCKRIYDASERKSDNSIKDLLQPWKEKWAKKGV